jgi:hypothetical protein
MDMKPVDNEDEEEEEEEDDEEEDEKEEDELAMKLLRIFLKSNDQFMVIFAEYGWCRKFKVEIQNDLEIIFTVSIDIPPDELFQSAGFHALDANLKGFDKRFKFFVPEGRRLSRTVNDKVSTHYYPDESFPEWVFFKINLQPLGLQLEAEANVDLKDNIKKRLRSNITPETSPNK